MLELFHQSSFACSRKVTELYSTSFTLGIRALDKKYHDAIYGIYGFVRFADEIVDTFHEWNKEDLFIRFREDTNRALDEKISLNPILHAFQITVHNYNIDRGLIDSFLNSMEMDLHISNYKQENYTEYIYGSAEVVGLMCLKVFCEKAAIESTQPTKRAKIIFFIAMGLIFFNKCRMQQFYSPSFFVFYQYHRF